MKIGMDQGSKSFTSIDIFYVDIPTEKSIGDPDSGWLNVGKFDSIEQAVEFIRKHFGPCDDEGRISLITKTETESEEKGSDDGNT